MLLSALILIPFSGILFILGYNSYNINKSKVLKRLSLMIWLLYNNSSKHFQFVQEQYKIGYYDFYLDIDGLSIYFILLTTMISLIGCIYFNFLLKTNFVSIYTVPYHYTFK